MVSPLPVALRALRSSLALGLWWCVGVGGVGGGVGVGVVGADEMLQWCASPNHCADAPNEAEHLGVRLPGSPHPENQQLLAVEG